MTTAYWQTLQNLLDGGKLIIDRPAGQTHPRYPDLVYPLNYGFLDDTTAGDGDGIDVWVGSLDTTKLTGILCTFDTVKRDAEIKLLAGCSAEDLQTIMHFQGQFMRFLYVPRPEEN